MPDATQSRGILKGHAVGDLEHEIRGRADVLGERARLMVDGIRPVDGAAHAIADLERRRTASSHSGADVHDDAREVAADGGAGRGEVGVHLDVGGVEGDGDGLDQNHVGLDRGQRRAGDDGRDAAGALDDGFVPWRQRRGANAICHGLSRVNEIELAF